MTDLIKNNLIYSTKLLKNYQNYLVCDFLNDSDLIRLEEFIEKSDAEEAEEEAKYRMGNIKN